MISRGPLQLRGITRWRIRRAIARLRHGSDRLDKSPVIFGNAIPKNGSKLLFNILKGLPSIGPFVDSGLNEIKPYRQGVPTPAGWIARQLQMLQPGDIRAGYLWASPEHIERVCRPGWAVFFIRRDPRDTLISGIFYALEIHTGHILNEYYRTLPDMETRISAAIQGIPEGKYQLADIRTIYDRYLGWLEQPEVCDLRFEDLVESREAQLRRMLSYLETRGFLPELPMDEAVGLLASQMSPRKSATFRRGKSGTWKEHFTDHNKAEFKAIAGDLLIRLGYEKDMEW